MRRLPCFWKLLRAVRTTDANSVRYTPTCLSGSNFYPVTAYLPKERDFVVSELQYIIDTVKEEEMVEYRRKLKSLE